MAGLYAEVYYDYWRRKQSGKGRDHPEKGIYSLDEAEPDNSCVDQIRQMIKDGGDETKAWHWEPEEPVTRKEFQEEGGSQKAEIKAGD